MKPKRAPGVLIWAALAAAGQAALQTDLFKTRNATEGRGGANFTEPSAIRCSNR